MMTKFYIYMLMNASGMFYVGLTTHLQQILWKHRQKKMLSFNANHAFSTLVLAEELTDIHLALARFDELKNATYYQKQLLMQSANAANS